MASQSSTQCCMGQLPALWVELGYGRKLLGCNIITGLYDIFSCQSLWLAKLLSLLPTWTSRAFSSITRSSVPWEASICIGLFPIIAASLSSSFPFESSLFQLLLSLDIGFWNFWLRRKHKQHPFNLAWGRHCCSLLNSLKYLNIPDH